MQQTIVFIWFSDFGVLEGCQCYMNLDESELAGAGAPIHKYTLNPCVIGFSGSIPEGFP